MPGNNNKTNPGGRINVLNSPNIFQRYMIPSEKIEQHLKNLSKKISEGLDKRIVESIEEKSVNPNDTDRAAKVAGRILYDEIRQNQKDVDYITHLFLKLDRAKKIPCNFMQGQKAKRHHRLIATRFFEVICDKIMNEEIKL